MKFRIAHKGLVLVGIPLLLGLGTSIALLILLDQAEQVAAAAVHSRNVVAAINMVTADAVRIHKTFDIKGNFTEIPTDRIEADLQALHTDTDHLFSLVKDDPQYSGWTKDGVQKVREIEIVAPKIINALKNNDPVTLLREGIKYRQKFREMLIKGSSYELLSVANKDKEIEAMEPERQAALRDRAKQLVIAGMVFNVLLALSLAVFFSKQFARRLKVMKDNSARLLAEKTLNPIVKGSDEIAEVDQAFHKMANELTAARERDKQVQELRNQVVAMVTHDLRTPLQTITTFLEVLETEKLDETAKDLLPVAERNADRMAALINDLLDMERIQTGTLPLDRSAFPVARAVTQAFELVQPLAVRHSIELKCSGDATIVADERRIVQILTNLIGNAIKFSADKTSINVSISQTAKTTNIDVTDQGRGIPQEKLSDVFKQFHQVQDADSIKLGGSGFGLAICKALVELHGGTISVTSTEGKGSTFTIKLARNSSE